MKGLQHLLAPVTSGVLGLGPGAGLSLRYLHGSSTGVFAPLGWAVLGSCVCLSHDHTHTSSDVCSCSVCLGPLALPLYSSCISHVWLFSISRAGFRCGSVRFGMVRFGSVRFAGAHPVCDLSSFLVSVWAFGMVTSELLIRVISHLAFSYLSLSFLSVIFGSDGHPHS